MNNELEKIVTVLTPTYNRKDYIDKLYNSLKMQTCKNFTWMIVDDGSTDNTECKIEYYIKENILDIIYLKKKNGGKHTALNFGISKITTPLVFIVDSDDYLTENAIEIINNDYQYIKSSKYCGLAYLRGYSKDRVIGNEFLNEGYANLNYVRYVDNVQGDKAEVWKTEYLKKIPFPVFENEKFIGEHYVWCQLSENYDMYMRNKIIYITEYLVGGLTRSGRALRIRCPKGGMASSEILLKKKYYPLKTRIKNGILYNCYSFFLRKSLVTRCKETNRNTMIIVLTALPGFVIYIYWKVRYL